VIGKCSPAAASTTTSPDWIAAIEHFIDGYNRRAQPVVWTNTGDQVLNKAIKKKDASETLDLVVSRN